MVRLAATSPTIVPTVMRSPRMHGLPPNTSGSRVILVSGVIAQLPNHCRTTPDERGDRLIRLQHVSTTEVEIRKLGRTRVERIEAVNPLAITCLRPEVTRHHQLEKTLIALS